MYILEWRTDLEFIDEEERHIVFKFKLVRKRSEYATKKDEAREQLERYKKSRKYAPKEVPLGYDRLYAIIVDLEGLEVEVLTT